MRKAKIGLLVALLVGLTAVMVINEVGIGRYPPTGQFPDGTTRGFYPATCVPVWVPERLP
jgi:hypothetical protein